MTLSDRLQRFVLALAPALAYICVVIFDPFGLYTTTNKVSKEIAFRVLAVLESGQGADEVAVVLLDDASANHLNDQLGYPITFHNHAIIAQSILCPGPTSLFIDFSFRNIRTRDPGGEASFQGTKINADLHDFIRALTTRAGSNRFCPVSTSAAGRKSVIDTDVMIARTRSTDHKCDPLFEDQRPLAENCNAAKSIGHLRAAAKPLTLARADTEGAYLVAVKPEETFPNGEVEGGKPPVEPSPALAALLAFCAKLPPDKAAGFAGCRDRDHLLTLLSDANANRRLTPVWGYFRKPARAHIDQQCHSDQLQEGGRAWRAVSMVFNELWSAAVRGLTDGESRRFGKQLCLPFETITAMELLNLGSNCGGRDPAVCRAEQAAVTAGRMVFYGATVADVHDLTESPVLGFVPGVAAHAMAAANLLERGNAFIREPPKLTDWLNAQQVVEISLIALWAAALLPFHKEQDRGAPRIWERFKVWLWFLLFTLLISLLVTTTLYLARNWAPTNWLGLWAALMQSRPKA